MSIRPRISPARRPTRTCRAWGNVIGCVPTAIAKPQAVEYSSQPMSEPADEIPHLQSPSAWAIAVAFALVYLSWGTTYYVTSLAMAHYHMPPALFGGIRLLMAGTILLVFQLCRGQSLRISLGDGLRLFLVSCC